MWFPLWHPLTIKTGIDIKWYKYIYIYNYIYMEFDGYHSWNRKTICPACLPRAAWECAIGHLEVATTRAAPWWQWHNGIWWTEQTKLRWKNGGSGYLVGFWNEFLQFPTTLNTIDPRPWQNANRMLTASCQVDPLYPYARSESAVVGDLGTMLQGVVDYVCVVTWRHMYLLLLPYFLNLTIMN